MSPPAAATPVCGRRRRPPHPVAPAYLQRVQLHLAHVVFVQGLEGDCGKQGGIKVNR